MSDCSLPCATAALIGAVKADRTADAVPVFAELVEDLTSRGCRLGGVAQADARRDGRSRCDMKLRDLTTGEIVLISEDRGNEARGCRLSYAALNEACENVKHAIRNGVDLVIVNKFGKAESEGAGMREVIALALDHETPVLVCANPEHHGHLIEFCGELAATLPLEPAAIRSWLDAVLVVSDRCAA